MLKSFSQHSTTSVQEKLQEEQIIDALFCHSLNENTLKAHNKVILDTSLTGTTMCSIFLIPIQHQRYLNKIRLEYSSSTSSNTRPFLNSPADQTATDMGVLPKYAEFGRTYRVICGSVGDSRCVMVGCSAEPIEMQSKDSLDSSNHAFTRTSNFVPSLSQPITGDVLIAEVISSLNMISTLAKKRSTSMQSLSEALKLTSSSPPKIISTNMHAPFEKGTVCSPKLATHKELDQSQGI